MAINVAINGYGRIGRMVLRALYESGRTDEINIVAVNDLGDVEVNAYLTKRDTAHGKFDADVSIDGKRFVYSSTGGTADQYSNLYVPLPGSGEWWIRDL